MDFFEQNDCQKNKEVFIENLLSVCEKTGLFLLEFHKVPQSPKTYLQLIEKKSVFFIYTDLDKAKKYVDDELKDMNVTVRKINENELINLLSEIVKLGGDGFIVNYPYNWAIFKVK